MRKKILRKIQDNLHRLIALVAVLVCLVTVVLAGTGQDVYVYADTYVGQNDYDYTNVLDDLEGSTINGEEFSVLNYPYTDKEDIQVLTFTEYCYSYYENQQGNYALYVYVYNPQGLDISTSSLLNQISIRFGSDESVNYNKYPIYFCNCSTGDYEGLYYKFKVYLTSDEKAAALDALNSLGRMYTVSEIEIKTADSAVQSYYVSTTYTFKGFAAGYGNNNSEESTLTLTQEEADTLTLSDIGTAYYRPSGTNGTDNYTQDNLSSVYFAVPNSYLEKYGYLCGLSADWYEAVLYPMLVTSNRTGYWNIFAPDTGDYSTYLGVDVSELSDTDTNFRRAYSGFYKVSTSTGGYNYDSTMTYGFPTDSADIYTESILLGGLVSYAGTMYSDYYGRYLSKLYNIFLDEDYSGDSCTEVISSAKIKQALSDATEAEYENYELVAETYASYLFDSYDTEETTFHVDMREGYDGYENSSLSLTSQKISYKNWWYKLWGNETVTTTTFDDIPALQALTDDDFYSVDDDAYNAQNLYVAESDYTNLKEFYEKWSTKTTYTDASGTTYDTDGYTVYLCRFDVSPYISYEATLFQKCSGDEGWLQTDSTNHYFFQETVYLDFDIIDVTFTNGYKDTVIGVVMSPIDIIYASTSPVYTTKNSSCLDLDWEFILGMLLLVVLIIILWPVMPYIVQAVVWIVSLPFKLIAAIVKAFKKPKDQEVTVKISGEETKKTKKKKE